MMHGSYWSAAHDLSIDATSPGISNQTFVQHAITKMPDFPIGDALKLTLRPINKRSLLREEHASCD
jgi:hypothetical protein